MVVAVDAKTADSQMLKTVAVENFYWKLLETVAVEKQMILKGSYFSIQYSRKIHLLSIR